MNAYHCLVYGEDIQDRQLISIGNKVIKSYLGKPKLSQSCEITPDRAPSP